MKSFSPSETHWIRSAQMGDRGAFDELFAPHAVALQLYVRYRMGKALRSQLQPNDIVQEVFLTAFQNFQVFHGKSGRELFRWLRWIADCRLADEARRAGRLKRGGGIRFDPPSEPFALEPVEETADRAPGPRTQAALREETKRIEEAFEELPERDQEIILLRHYEGLSSKEAAAKMGIEPNHVDVLLFRAMKKWKESGSRKTR